MLIDLMKYIYHVLKFAHNVFLLDQSGVPLEPKSLQQIIKEAWGNCICTLETSEPKWKSFQETWG